MGPTATLIARVNSFGLLLLTLGSPEGPIVGFPALRKYFAQIGAELETRAFA